MATVYLLHFDEPVGDTNNVHGYALHYLGSAGDLEARLTQHRSGNGARLMEVVKELGISWRLARTRDGGRSIERRLKAYKNAPRLCPICNPDAAMRHGRI